MQSRKRLFLAQLFQAGFNFFFHVGFRHLCCTVLRGFAQGGTGVEPVAVAAGVGVQIRQRAAQGVEGIVEVCDVFARLDHAQTDAGSLDAAHGLGTHCGRTAQHDGARHPAGSHDATIPLVALVFLVRHRVFAVDLCVDDGVPAFRQIADQFIADVGCVQRDGAGQDHGAGIAAHPQLMNDRRHQAQHAAGTLESFQRGPVIVQAVEDFRVDGIAGNHPITVVHFFGVCRKITGVVLVHLAERRAHAVAGFRILAVEEQAAAHHLKALIGGNRLPDRFHTTKGMFNGFQCVLSCFAADLDIRFRDRSHHQTVLAGACGFGDLLNERVEVIERPGGQTGHTIQFSGIRHKLVHQDQAGAAGIKQVFQRFTAGRNALFICILDKIVQFRTASRFRQLRCHFAPKSVDGDAGEIDGPFGSGGVQCRAHQHRHVGFGQSRNACLCQNGLDAGDAVCRYPAAHDVVKRQHAVGLAAAKRGF